MLTMEHFHCICINFNSRKVEYLDNRSYDTVIDDHTYGLYARALVCVSVLLLVFSLFFLNCYVRVLYPTSLLVYKHCYTMVLKLIYWSNTSI